MKQRAWWLTRRVALFAALGLLYAMVFVIRGFAIPCPFHWLTGLYCPGCGATRMFAALLRLDFAAAWHNNVVLLPFLPVLAAIGVIRALGYVRTGVWTTPRWQSVLFWVMGAILVVFGVLRNIPALSFLQPI